MMCIIFDLVLIDIDEMFSYYYRSFSFFLDEKKKNGNSEIWEKRLAIQWYFFFEFHLFDTQWRL